MNKVITLLRGAGRTCYSQYIMLLLINNICADEAHFLKHTPFTTKLKCRIYGFQPQASRINAIKALSELTNTSLAQANYICKNLPQLLCVGGCESFYSVVLTIDEAKEVDKILSPHFEMQFWSASESVLPYGACVLAPWDIKQGSGPWSSV